MSDISRRRRFLTSMGGVAALFAGKSADGAQTPVVGTTPEAAVPGYALAQSYKTLKQSSYDRTGGNRDSWPMTAGQTLEVFQSSGPGVITHIWFTIAAQGAHHLKELVLRIYWDGNAKPSVETPIGDFFGLNLGEYFLYQSAFLNCSSVKALNCYFAMPFRRSARITVTNEGERPVGALYSNIDYQIVPALPDGALYFHAQYRQATPNPAVTFAPGQPEINIEGQRNYVFLETRGKGQVMGVTLGVLQNSNDWFGEGDEMVFIDSSSKAGGLKPVINGTGTEDYFCGAWDFGGRDGAVPFSNLYNGAPYIGLPERAGGRYCLYRWHADNPIAFEQSIKHTIEHGHANDRADCFYSVGYWYQSEPYTDFPALPSVAERVPALKTD
ncbi:MAG: glycoside hydrolase family 172 protein [Bryobacteraceae bacterium]